MAILDAIFQDVILTIPLFAWAFFVVRYLSRWLFNFIVKRGYPAESATYVGRKIIHIFAAGVTTLFIPFFFKEPFLPFLMALLFALYTYLPHKTQNLYLWFQDKANISEVIFCLMWGFCILGGWFIDKTFWLGVIPALFLSFGDGITGIVRNIRYRKRVKGWEGSIAMLLVCVLIGLKMGWAGIITGILATIFERFEFIDDNISIPVVSFSVLAIFYYFFPSLTKFLI